MMVGPLIVLVALTIAAHVAADEKEDLIEKNRHGYAQLIPELTYGKDDMAFGGVEQIQGDKPWGRVLDAGTGPRSMSWLGTLNAESVTAVTAAPDMKDVVLDQIKLLNINKTEVVLGNWFGKEPLQYGEEFDTIICDYLIGAMDAFSPYMQGSMLRKLLGFLKPGGRLYVMGLQPIVTNAKGPANIVSRMARARDALILLAGHRVYREYPVKYTESKVNDLPNIQHLETLIFPNYYDYSRISDQLAVGRSKLDIIAYQTQTPELVEGLRKHLDALDAEALELTQNAPENAIELGFDYTVALEKLDDADEEKTCANPDGCGDAETAAKATS